MFKLSADGTEVLLPSLTPSAETGSDSTIKNYVNANLYIRNNIDLTTVEPTYISFSGAGASDCFTSTTQKMHNSANDRVFQNSASATSLSVSMPTSTTAGWTTMQAYSIFPSSETGNLKSVISPGNVSYVGSLEGVGCGRHLFTAQNNGETEFKVVLTSSDPTYRVRLAMYEATNIIQSWQVETGLTANYAGTDSSCYVGTAQNVTVPIKMNVEKDKSYFIKCKVVDTSGNYINTNGKYCTCKVDGEIKTTVAN